MKRWKHRRQQNGTCCVCGDGVWDDVFCRECHRKILDPEEFIEAVFWQRFNRAMTGRPHYIDHAPVTVLKQIDRIRAKGQKQKRRRRRKVEEIDWSEGTSAKRSAEIHAEGQRSRGEGPGPCKASEWTKGGDYEADGTCDYPAVRHKAA